MRLSRITTNYFSYLKQFYAQRPELKEKTYAVQYQTLMSDCYMWADFWTNPLGKLGYEVWEPVGNAEPMQKGVVLKLLLRFCRNMLEALEGRSSEEVTTITGTPF
mgnify:CR=1 FL=1